MRQLGDPVAAQIQAQQHAEVTQAICLSDAVVLQAYAVLTRKFAQTATSWMPSIGCH